MAIVRIICGNRFQSRLCGRQILSLKFLSTRMPVKSAPYLEYSSEWDVEYLGEVAAANSQTNKLHFSRYSHVPARFIPDVFPCLVKSDGTRLPTDYSLCPAPPHWEDSTVAKCVHAVLNDDDTIIMDESTMVDQATTFQDLLKINIVTASQIAYCLFTLNQLVNDVGRFYNDAVKYLMQHIFMLALSPFWPKRTSTHRIWISTSHQGRQNLATSARITMVDQHDKVSPKNNLIGVTDSALMNRKGFQLLIGEGKSKTDQYPNPGVGQLVTAMLAQFSKSDVAFPVWGFTLGPAEYKLFSLNVENDTALIQEYPSVRHELKLVNFLPILGIAERKSIIKKSTPPHSRPSSSFT